MIKIATAKISLGYSGRRIALAKGVFRFKTRKKIKYRVNIKNINLGQFMRMNRVKEEDILCLNQI